MNATLGALACGALLCGAGAWLDRLLRVGGQGASFGRAWLLGCAALSVALHIPLAVDGHISHRYFTLAAAAGLAATAWYLASAWKRGERAHWGGWITDLPWPARLLMIAAIVLVVSHSLRSELSGYDARTAFALKARILYDTGDIRGEDFVDVNRLNFNPTYPLLLPLVEAEMYSLQGTYQLPGLRLLFAGFVLAVASIYAGEIRRFASARIAAGSAFLLLLAPMLNECFEGAGLSGSADLPLCAFVLAGTLELFRFCSQPDWRSGCAAGLLLGAAVMTKQEGLLWVAVGGVTAIGALATGGRKNWKLAVIRAIPGAVALGALGGLHLLVHRGMPVSPYYPSIAAALTDPQWLVQLADRPLHVVGYALRETLRTTRWGLLWICVIGSLVLLRRGPVPREIKCWRAASALILLTYMLTMIVSPLHLHYQLVTTFSRLTLHFFPLAMLVMAEQVVASGWLGELLTGESPTLSTITLPLPATAGARRANSAAAIGLDEEQRRRVA